MKQALFFILFGIFLLPNKGLAGGFNAIELGDCGNNSPISNEYYRVSYNPSLCIECDNDRGDADNGVELFYLSGTSVRAKTCRIDPWGDRWHNDREIQKCSDKASCIATYFMGEDNPHSLCVRGNVRHRIINEKVPITDDFCPDCCYKDNEVYTRKQACLKDKYAEWKNGDCSCRTPDGAHSYRWDWKLLKCVESGTSTITPPPPRNENEYVNKCHPSVCKSDICKACCAKPTSETVWDRTGQTCQCVNGGNFIKENNQWICKVETTQTTQESYVCDSVLLKKLSIWKTQCAQKSEILNLITELEIYCAGKPTENVFLRLYDELKETVNKICIATPVVVEDDADKVTAIIVAIKSRIKTASNTLNEIRSGFDVSVWKDEEGKFNTSRLVSDSVAGVVLGTAGGLITSNVVKKNQVENGFEDIQCTVGGQVVSNWGDQFRVGIQ